MPISDPSAGIVRHSVLLVFGAHCQPRTPAGRDKRPKPFRYAIALTANRAPEGKFKVRPGTAVIDTTISPIRCSSCGCARGRSMSCADARFLILRTSSQGFGIEGLKRSSAQPEPFGRLSDGTREQIAVLVRLALGAMLAERGQAVPIILDDALVYSDDDRITRMFDALSRAGQQQQIIVLTCRTRAFEQLGGRSIKIDTTGAPTSSAIAA